MAVRRPSTSHAWRWALLPLAAGVLCQAVPAAAQSRIDDGLRPAKIPTKVTLSEADRGRLAMTDWSECVLRRDRQEVLRLLNLPLGDRQAWRGMIKLASNNNACLSQGEIRFNPGLSRGIYFVVLYREKYAKRAPALADTPYTFVITDEDGAIRDNAMKQLALYDFGGCVVRRAPDLSHAIVVTNAGSPEERSAFAALKPHLGACLSREEKFEISKTMLSGLLAELLYRNAAVAPAEKL